MCIRDRTYALHRDELQVIVPCDHPYADRDPFPVSALAEEPFIQLEEDDDYELMAAFDEMGIRPNVKYIAREDRTILAMAVSYTHLDVYKRQEQGRSICT